MFDFDHTLIDDNSDTFIMSLCPELKLLCDLASKRKEFGSWTKFMDHTLSLIHGQGRTNDEVVHHMKKVRLFEQAVRAVRAIKESEGTDSIIVSDSNTVFIDVILEACDEKGSFSSVITNPAYFDESGRLRVQEYHSHDCEACKRTPNLCKGRVLEEYRKQHKIYDKVVYVGDGKNDYCPCLKLTEKDVAVCREGYALAELLRHSTTCRAQVHTVDFVNSLGDFIVSNFLEERSCQ